VLYRQIPFLRFIIPLCAGIIASLYINPDLLFILILLALAATILTIVYFTDRSFENIFYGILLSSVLFLSGLFLSASQKASFTKLENHETLFLSVVLDFPEEKENSFLIKTKLRGIIKDGMVSGIKGSMMLYHQKNSSAIKNLIPGDILIFRCVPREIRNKGNPHEFNYRFYMESQGYRYFAFTRASDILGIKKTDRRAMRFTALICREQIIRLYREKGITGKRLALASAITLGEKEFLEENQKDNFSRSGVMHIMAVSGLHVGILSYFIFTILFFLKKRSGILHILITLTVIWVFSFIAGLTPSVLRASLMFSFLYAGQLMKRKINHVNSMLASAFILILLRPMVIFNSAFLLSYMAVLFIILFYNGVYNTISFRWLIPDKLWQMASVSITAQAGTLPLTLLMFNRIPVLFLFTNMIIIPLAALTVIAGFLTVIFSPLQFLSSLFAHILDIAAGCSDFLAEKTARLSFSSIENTGLLLHECMLLLICLAIILHFITEKKGRSIIYLLSVIFLFASSVTIKKIVCGRSNEMIVYNTPGSSTVGFRTGNKLYLFYTADEVPKEVRRHCAITGLYLESKKIDRLLPLRVKAGNKSIFITGNYFRTNSGTIPDILIMTGRRAFYSRGGENPSLIIFTLASTYRTPYTVTNSKADICYWFTRYSGCCRVKLD